ncbi:MAG TPA: hypothetical protein VH134_14360 [Candidatus Dormibacteraeota bacterium]|nr:hypothetical protein [Candidatus Dormibacteraeota bacterium]
MSSPAVTVVPSGGDVYTVRVGTRTEHRVTARPDALRRAAAADETPERTLERAFAFLLEREPPESILRSFALEDIARYFPEFWTTMRP